MTNDQVREHLKEATDVVYGFKVGRPARLARQCVKLAEALLVANRERDALQRRVDGEHEVNSPNGY